VKENNANKNPDPQNPETNPLRGRLIACTQSTGRCGKSTTVEGIITWLRFAGVPYVAFDADGEHQTLASRYPDEVDRFDTANSPEEFSRLMREVSDDFPVSLIDFPAQSNRFILNSLEQFKLLEVFAAKGIRLTVLIFAVDDKTAQRSAAETLRALGDRVDYLLIENPAYKTSVVFNKSPMRKWFADRNTPLILIPPVLQSTISAWEAAERKHKRFLPLDEACQHPDLHEIQRAELEFLRDRFCAQCQQHALRIVPDVALIKNRLPEVNLEPPRKEINPLDDPLY
jgi:hypothetical protein